METVKQLSQGFTALPSDLQGWNSDAAIFRELIEEIKPKTIIEVGTWKGLSAINMAKICKELGLNTKIYCVDTWLGAGEFYTDPRPERNLMKKHGYPQVYYQFISNVINERVDDMIIPVPLPSIIASHILPDADLIYIDGDHSENGVMLDIAHYKSKGKVLFGDDYGNTVFPGVKSVVDSHLPNRIISNNWHWVWKK